MKLYKALKLKKKLVGEIAKLKSQIQSKNSYLISTSNVLKYDVREIEKELDAKLTELVDLKLSMYRANLPIQKTIFDLTETKGLLAFWTSVSVTEGEQLLGYSDTTVRQYGVCIDEVERDQKVKILQTKIDTMQEELDTFNYTTEL